MISATMAGIVFAKLARPKARSNTVMFSKNAVITQREGQLWLMFRLGNMRKSHLIESHLRAQLIHHRKTTKEGEILSYECEELPITTLTLKNEPDEDFATEDRTLFIFPTTVAHRYVDMSQCLKITEKSLIEHCERSELGLFERSVFSACYFTMRTICYCFIERL